VRIGALVGRNDVWSGAQIVRCGVRIGAICICSKSRLFTFGFRIKRPLVWAAFSFAAFV